MWKSKLQQVENFFAREIWLLDAFGNPADSGQYRFVACAIAADWKGSKTLKLPDSYLKSSRCGLSFELGEKYDLGHPHLIWLRGRLARIFGVCVPFGQEAVDFYRTSFIAVKESRNKLEISPFAITGGVIGDYGVCELSFAFSFAPGVSSRKADSILTDFTSLLARDDSVTDFSDYISDGMEGYRAEMRDARAHVDELGGWLSDMDTEDGFDGAEQSFSYFSKRECLDCGGTGREYNCYPGDQTCESCKGLGEVHW
ncbi:MAG: hypothetical protein AAF483_23825 [Planctomycetota bacterium]